MLVACFLPGRAKDLLAPLQSVLKEPTNAPEFINVMLLRSSNNIAYFIHSCEHFQGDENKITNKITVCGNCSAVKNHKIFGQNSALQQ
jgi:hypothetical protein